MTCDCTKATKHNGKLNKDKKGAPEVPQKAAKKDKDGKKVDPALHYKPAVAPNDVNKDPPAPGNKDPDKPYFPGRGVEAYNMDSRSEAGKNGVKVVLKMNGGPNQAGAPAPPGAKKSATKKVDTDHGSKVVVKDPSTKWAAEAHSIAKANYQKTEKHAADKKAQKAHMKTEMTPKLAAAKIQQLEIVAEEQGHSVRSPDVHPPHSQHDHARKEGSEELPSAGGGGGGGGPPEGSPGGPGEGGGGGPGGGAGPGEGGKGSREQ